MTAIREFTGGGAGNILKLEAIKITKATRVEGKVVEPGEVIKVLPSLARMLRSAEMAVALSEDEVAEIEAALEAEAKAKAEADAKAAAEGGKKNDGGKK